MACGTACGCHPLRIHWRHIDRIRNRLAVRTPGQRRHGPSLSMEGAKGGAGVRRLRFHRFPDNIIRSRTGPGRYNDFGEYVSGTVFKAALAANVQPVRTEDLQLTQEGTRLSETLKVYVPVRIELPVRAGRYSHMERRHSHVERTAVAVERGDD